MKVLVIVEDPVNDQFIAQPIVEALVPAATVTVLTSPRMRGLAQALDLKTLLSIVTERPMFDRFVIMVDRDGDEHREKRIERLENNLPKLVGCLAWQELEVWMLALHRKQLTEKVGFSEVRTEPDPKERFAAPLMWQYRLGPGGGRKHLMRSLAGQLSSLLAVCPELKDLKAKLALPFTS